ncbi:MAG TPA: glycosyl hydrolase family 28 protein [Polyangia bacterium]
MGVGCAGSSAGPGDGTGGGSGQTGTAGSNAGAGGNGVAGAAGGGAGGASPVGTGGVGGVGGVGGGGRTGTGGAASGGTSGSSGTLGGGGGAGTAGTAGAGTGGAGRGGAAGTSTGAAGSAGAGGRGGAGGASAAGAGGAGRGGAAGTSTGGGAVGGTSGTTGTGGAAGASNDPCANNPAAVPLPTIPARAFNVTSNGAAGDNKTDNTAAIQATLDAAAAAGGGTVTVPSGTFLSGPIVIGSSTNLVLSSGAVLKMLPRASYGSGDTPFITATTSSAHDIAITGSGTIEGQGQDWWDAFAADSSISRPQEVNLGHVTRVQISGIRLQSSPEEHIWVKSDTSVTITGITISTLAVSGKSPPKNTDGVDVTATGMFFCNNNVACGDDNIAMSGTNLYIGYSTFGVGHGCSIGSITKNGVSGVTVDHLTMNGTTSGIRMKSARDRGGTVKDLTYSNVTMTNVQNPVYITSYYPDLPANPTSDTAMAVTATTPYWQNITIKNLTATGSTNGGIIWGLPEAKVSGLTFDNVKIQASTGMEIFHATGVQFTNGSSVTPKSGAAVTVYDAAVTGVTTTPY